MIPISDENPTKLKPYLTVALMAGCFAVYAWQFHLKGDAYGDFMLHYGFTPSSLMSPQFEANGIPAVPAVVSIFTALFLHGGVLHLIGNMLFLGIFGHTIESAMGHARFLIFYLLCGVAAALTMAFMDPSSVQPMVGASGAISGVLGAYVLLYPRAKVTIPIPLFLIIYSLRIKPVWVVGGWFAMQLLALTGPDTSGTAWWAHVCGFAAGICLTPFFKSSAVPLFGPLNTSGPESK